jgi:hypothetical protein
VGANTDGPKQVHELAVRRKQTRVLFSERLLLDDKSTDLLSYAIVEPVVLQSLQQSDALILAYSRRYLKSPRL